MTGAEPIFSIPDYNQEAPQGAFIVGSVSKISGEISYSVFDIAKDASIDLSSDITDYYTEDNSVLNDHIAQKPMIINISGYQGELVSSIDHPISMGQYDTSIKGQINNFNLQTLAQKMDVLNPLNPIMPSQIVQARQKISQLADKADSLRSKVNSAYDISKGLQGEIDNKNKPKKRDLFIYEKNQKAFKRQAEAFQRFKQLREENVLCNVFTPWGTYLDMAILTISARQSEDSEYITDFSLSFKKFNLTQTLYAKFDTESARDYITKAQKAEMQEVGKGIGKEQNISIIRGGANKLNPAYQYVKGALIKL